MNVTDIGTHRNSTSSKGLESQLKLESITFPDSTIFQPTKLNVIIGANNVGKSRLLKQIRNTLLGNEDNYQSNINTEFILKFPNTPDAFTSQFDISEHLKPAQDGLTLKDYCSLGLRPSYNDGYERIPTILNQIPRNWNQYISEIYDREGSSSSSEFIDSKFELRRSFGSMFVNYCATEDRLLLAAGSQYHGLDDNHSNTLSWLISQPQIIRELNSHLKNAFHKQIKLDLYTNSGKVTVKVLNTTEPLNNNATTQSQSEAFQLADLYDEGDGIKSFFAVAAAIVSNQKPVILIDEPESHLHPPQAYKLGKLIAQQAEASVQTQVFVATHSIQILRGMLDQISKPEDISILNIVKNRDTTQYKATDKQTFDKAATRSFIRDGKFYEGLFSSNAVFVESESDSLVYNSLLTKVDPEKEFMFVSTHGKDQLPFIANFYRTLGAQPKFIVDFDIFNTVSKFTELGASMGMTKTEVEQARKIANTVKQKLRDAHLGEGMRTFFKKNTVENFKQYTEQINEVRNLFLNYGCLIVATGELETVLENLYPYSNSKSSWTVDALDVINNSAPKQLEELKITKDLKKILE